MHNDSIFKSSVTRIFFVLTLLCSSQMYLAQEDGVQQVQPKSSSIYLAYNSSIIYPGLRTGLELPLNEIRVNKTKMSGADRLVIKHRFVTGNLAWYHHPTFHDNIYVTLGYTWRRTHGNGFFADFSPELGYSRTFLGGTTYRVDDQGNVSVKKFAGHNYALVSIGGGLGYDFSMKNDRPIALYYKCNLLLMFPYNSTFNLRPAMELGIKFSPVGFLTINTKSKLVNKNSML